MFEPSRSLTKASFQIPVLPLGSQPLLTWTVLEDSDSLAISSYEPHSILLNLLGSMTYDGINPSPWTCLDPASFKVLSVAIWRADRQDDARPSGRGPEEVTAG
jgi:hypothetical protein